MTGSKDVERCDKFIAVNVSLELTVKCDDILCGESAVYCNSVDTLLTNVLV